MSKCDLVGVHTARHPKRLALVSRNMVMLGEPGVSWWGRVVALLYDFCFDRECYV